MPNEDKSKRGPGSVEVRPVWGSFLYRAAGTVDTVNSQGPMGMNGYYNSAGYFQPMAHRQAWGFSFDQALKRCKAKLCEAVNEDIERSEARERAAQEKKDRTRHFENPCAPDPNVTNRTRT